VREERIQRGFFYTSKPVRGTYYLQNLKGPYKIKVTVVWSLEKEITSRQQRNRGRVNSYVMRRASSTVHLRDLGGFTSSMAEFCLFTDLMSISIKEETEEGRRLKSGLTRGCVYICAKRHLFATGRAELTTTTEARGRRKPVYKAEPGKSKKGVWKKEEDRTEEDASSILVRTLARLRPFEQVKSSKIEDDHHHSSKRGGVMDTRGEEIEGGRAKLFQAAGDNDDLWGVFSLF